MLDPTLPVAFTFTHVPSLWTGSVLDTVERVRLLARADFRWRYDQSGTSRPPLTYGRDHGDGEVKGAGEFPLHPGFVRLQLQHHLLQLVKVLPGQVERLEQLRLPQVQLLPLVRLLVRLHRVEDRSADYQVGEGADDEGEGPDVLPLHGGARQGDRRRVGAGLEDGELGWFMAVLL